MELPRRSRLSSRRATKEEITRSRRVTKEVSGSSEALAATVVVAIPDNCAVGDDFIVEYEGRTFDVTVPDGCGPGDEMVVQVPRLVDSAAEPEPQPEDMVGQRAMACGLLSNGVLNGKKGTLVSYNAGKSLFKLGIDGMYPYVSIRRENLLPLPWEDPPDSSNDDEEPMYAPRAGLHYVGDRVLLERTDGSSSVATLVDYDEIFETFTVDIGARGNGRGAPGPHTLRDRRTP